MAEPACISCHCTALRTCAGGCSWLGVNPGDGTGVCSRCPSALAQWRHQQADNAAIHIDDDFVRQARIQIGPLDV